MLPPPPPTLVIKQLFLEQEQNKVEKRCPFFMRHEVFFYEFASVIEQCANLSDSPASFNLEGHNW
jgi:hypothetical protein